MQGQNTGPELSDWEAAVQANNEAIPGNPPVITAPAVRPLWKRVPVQVWAVLGAIAAYWLFVKLIDSNQAFTGVAGIVALVAGSIFGVYLYCLPAFIAYRRGHRNAAGIAVLTLLLGWTFIGWVIALIWALHNDR
jgi:hypothetical protein